MAKNIAINSFRNLASILVIPENAPAPPVAPANGAHLQDLRRAIARAIREEETRKAREAEVRRQEAALWAAREAEVRRARGKLGRAERAERRRLEEAAWEAGFLVAMMKG